MFENEEWRHIQEAPHYLISNYGRVKHIDRPDRARAVSISDKGFPIVTLYGADSKTRYVRHINVLVIREFGDPPYDHRYNAVWHIDGDLTNCNADNLKWDMRARVLEWNDMHRSGEPKYKTPRVRNNRTGTVYANAFECGMAEGLLESDVVWRVERQARNTEDDAARYRYLWNDNDL